MLIRSFLTGSRHEVIQSGMSSNHSRIQTISNHSSHVPKGACRGSRPGPRYQDQQHLFDDPLMSMSGIVELWGEYEGEVAER